jgi:hypothetical protein
MTLAVVGGLPSLYPLRTLIAKSIRSPRPKYCYAIVRWHDRGGLRRLPLYDPLWPLTLCRRPAGMGSGEALKPALLNQ